MTLFQVKTLEDRIALDAAISDIYDDGDTPAWWDFPGESVNPAREDIPLWMGRIEAAILDELDIEADNASFKASATFRGVVLA